jgi:phage-related protein
MVSNRRRKTEKEYDIDLEMELLELKDEEFREFIFSLFNIEQIMSYMFNKPLEEKKKYIKRIREIRRRDFNGA